MPRIVRFDMDSQTSILSGTVPSRTIHVHPIEDELCAWILCESMTTRPFGFPATPAGDVSLRVRWLVGMLTERVCGCAGVGGAATAGARCNAALARVVLSG